MKAWVYLWSGDLNLRKRLANALVHSPLRVVRPSGHSEPHELAPAFGRPRRSPP